ncbi:MAG: class I SAM-dependent methyltransferase [Lachnospiraceae bacterium]|nr:class I SAM-dependent methyltransferase [Lachnospiraceae bacterium]
MEVYSGFAGVYDTLMQDVPYGEWADFLDFLIAEYGVSERIAPDDGGTGAHAGSEKRKELSDPLAEERNLVVDLGCGTGAITALLADRGYDVAGVDLSPEMLAVAQDKNRHRRRPIPWLCQDMRKLDLYCTAGTFVSVCDSINYLLTEQDVLCTFRCVNRFLFPGGLFLFDFNTTHKYRDVIGTRTIAESGDDAAFIWENRFRARGSRNTAALTLFSRGEDGRYLRFCETHVQRGYTLAEIKRFLKAAGLVFLKAFDERTKRTPHARSERIFVAARESGKAPLRD